MLHKRREGQEVKTFPNLSRWWPGHEQPLTLYPHFQGCNRGPRNDRNLQNDTEWWWCWHHCWFYWKTQYLSVKPHCCLSACVLLVPSCLTLCDPRNRTPPGSSVHVIFPAGILERIAISFSRGILPNQGCKLVSCVSCISGGFFMVEPQCCLDGSFWWCE